MRIEGEVEKNGILLYDEKAGKNLLDSHTVAGIMISLSSKGTGRRRYRPC